MEHQKYYHFHKTYVISITSLHFFCYTVETMIDFPFFAPLGQDKIQDLIQNLPHFTYENEHHIFERGDQTADVYFILSGATKSVNHGPNGDIAYFRLRKAGDFFGYYSALSGEPRTATMIAVGETKLAKMSAQDFVHFITHHPALSEKMLRLIMTILREETDRITHMITLTAQQLIAAELAAQSIIQQSNIFEIPTRADLAAKLGLTRETVSRNLTALSKSGLIEINRDQVQILDLDRLEGLTSDTTENN